MLDERETLGPLAPYHLLVDKAVSALGASLAAQNDVERAVSVLDAELHGPAAEQIIDRTPHARVDLLDSVREQLSGSRTELRSNPLSSAGRVRILLLHQIDAAWWTHVTPYQDQHAVDIAPELLTLPELREERALRFRFTVQPAGWWSRGRDYLVKRAAPRRRPRVAGMKFLMARAEIVVVLNEIADALRERSPDGTPPLWVTSIVRSVEHQRHLSDLGYFALLPSSHCAGYAADVEMSWYEAFGAASTLQEILLEYRDRGVLNIIDEGQAWHLCLNPAHVSTYAASASELRG
jgi:hypothetical protein